jgi:hypothetical protein
VGVTLLPINIPPEMMLGNRDLKNVELLFRFSFEVLKHHLCLAFDMMAITNELFKQGIWNSAWK